MRNDGATWEELPSWDFDNIVISPGPGPPRRRRRTSASAPTPSPRPTCRCSASASATRASAASSGGDGRARARGHARAAQRRPPRRLAAVRRHPAGVPGGPLPLALRRPAAAGRPRADRLDERRRADGRRPPHAPAVGVQFHPESICTEYGRRLLANFRDLTASHVRATGRRRSRAPGAAGRPAPTNGSRRSASRPRLSLEVKRLDRLYDTERAFVHLFGDERARLLARQQQGRRARALLVHGRRGRPARRRHRLRRRRPGGARRARRDGRAAPRDDLRLPRPRAAPPALSPPTTCRSTSTAASSATSATSSRPTATATWPYQSTLPGRRVRLRRPADRLRPPRGRTYVLCLTDAGEPRPRASAGSRETAARLDGAAAAPIPDEPSARDRGGRVPPQPLPRAVPRRHPPRARTTCVDGDSYEVCLTNKVWTDVAPDPLPLYRTLRRVNPAPFSAFLRFGDAAVLSSSPERFLSIGRDRWVEAKPIKGTTRRGRTPAEDCALSEELRHEREEPRREPDDHRPAPQRPRRRLRDRHRPRAAPDGRSRPTRRCTSSSRRCAAACARTSGRRTASAPASPAAR